MDNKRLIVIEAITAAILICISIIFMVGADSKSPIITYVGDLTYTDGDDLSVLLEGVTARDNRDGDVTDNLMVESMIVLDGGDTARVTYIAKDNSNNIVKKSRIISYEGIGRSIYSASASGIAEFEAGTVTEVVTEEPTVASAEVETIAEETTSSETEETSEGTTSSSPENPVIELSASEGTVGIGGNFNIATYVSNITDDMDSREELYRRISIEGSYDTSIAGDYSFKVYCIDSDKNISNMENFTLHVAN